MHDLSFRMILGNMNCLSEKNFKSNAFLFAQLICFEVIVNKKDVDDYVYGLKVDYKELLQVSLSAIDVGSYAEKFKDLYNDKIKAHIYRFSSNIGFGINSFQNLLDTTSFNTLINSDKSIFGKLPVDIFFYISTFLTGDNITNEHTAKQIKHLSKIGDAKQISNFFSVIHKQKISIKGKRFFLMKSIFEKCKMSITAGHVFLSIVAFYISSLLVLFNNAQLLWVPLVALVMIFAATSIYNNREAIRNFCVKNVFIKSVFILNFLTLAPIFFIVYFDVTYLLFLPIMATLLINYTVFSFKDSEVKVAPNFSPKGLDAFFIRKDLVHSESLSSENKDISVESSGRVFHA